jgi:glutathione synthase/RimK-type ligase-like ATP-grasp enzyme
MILVLSHGGDDHAVRVLGEMSRARHPALLFDTAAFPQSITDFGAAWWRRPQPHVLHPGIEPGLASFTYSECHEAIDGMWAASRAAWVNDPHRDEIAHHKPFQLAVASELGLPLPRSLITNDPVEARAFIDDVGPDRTVYKTFLATEQHWRETRLLRREEMSLLARVRLAPVIFQEFVPARADVRVTVIGDDVFPVEVTKAPGAYPIDYRVDIDGSTFRPATVPDDVVEALRALLGRLGLRYGALDLLRTDDGYVFLEVNPAGEFLFVEDKTGLPLSAAMASYLADLDRQYAMS